MASHDEPRGIRSYDRWSLAIVVLAPAWPLLSLPLSNTYRRPALTPSLVVFVVVVACGALVLDVVARVRPQVDRHSVAVAVAVVSWSFLSFSWFFAHSGQDALATGVQLLLWATFTAAAARLGQIVVRHAVARQFLVIMLTIVVGIQSTQIVLLMVDQARQLERIAYGDPADAPPLVERPNVYWFVLDEYPRSDYLDAYVGVDNTEFEQSLEALGFQVSRSTSGSYLRTQQSLLSTLYMDHVVRPGVPIGNDFDVGRNAMLGDNPTVARLRAEGYRYVYGSSGNLTWSDCAAPPVDRCIRAGSGPLTLDENWLALARSTALGPLDVFEPEYTDLRPFPGLVQEEIESGQPFFAIYHMLAPHQPFRYGPTCVRGERNVEMTVGLPIEVLIEQFAHEVRCLNQDVTSTLEELLVLDPDAVIIVQGDHGLLFGVDWGVVPSSWKPETLTQRLATFNAIRLPVRCQDDARYAIEGEPLVNTFRIVFACLEDRDPELLERRVFVSAFDDLSTLEELPVPDP